MFLHEAVQLVKEGKYKYIMYSYNKYYLHSDNWIKSVCDHKEFNVSNVQWLTSDKWEVCDEILPEGVRRNKEGNLVKDEIYERWLVVAQNEWADDKFGTWTYTEKYKADRFVAERDNVVKVIHIKETIEVPYKG